MHGLSGKSIVIASSSSAVRRPTSAVRRSPSDDCHEAVERTMKVQGQRGCSMMGVVNILTKNGILDKDERPQPLHKPLPLLRKMTEEEPPSQEDEKGFKTEKRERPRIARNTES
ncbi:hypothetical protein DPMN_178618 [Dreissena polymorpha]|uniref:Uncharacterized protein n=1 Tax=Dreissena polymorpha TaxID=45954 RepID=A0A9D4EFL0_DREPO|nr:hypothetical protein DPMN_178618 [Dreissena polymorpha]